MKLICIDIEQCGFYSKISKLENPEHNNVCPSCFGAAIVAPLNYNPLVEIRPDSEEEANILARFHNTFNHLVNIIADETDQEE